MKIALQLGLIPGKEVKEKLAWAKDHGVEGLEISAWNYKPEQFPQALKDFEDAPVPVVSICGNPSFDFLDPDPKKRRASIEESKKYLELAGKFRAIGQIVPPIFGPPRLNDLSPLKDAASGESPEWSSTPGSSRSSFRSSRSCISSAHRKYAGCCC